ncbi:hypothetical protein BDV93DRAFT_603039 [Ceratobasidium sp. AG-I]|nr:hypothetical protein BDV93DRAFT_603039 [Ceratobasidium sp. AG-I]
MRPSLPNNGRYWNPRSQEIDGRENSELEREIHAEIVPRSPRGGGGRGGGGGGGGKSSGGGGGGSSGGGGGSRGGVSFGGGSAGRGSSSYSGGGGSRSTITSGAFAGRTIGGGTRGEVYGNSRYGSGYTYSGGSSVAGRGFPFGYWPVYMPIGGGVAYYGYREYGPADNSSRPGGEMRQAIVRSTSWPTIQARGWVLEGRQSGNATNSTAPAQVNNITASYYLVGDADTISVVMEELVKTCSVVNSTGTPIYEINTRVHVEQAVQYYRASSFMLALTSYNNSANLPSSAPADNNTAALPASADTPLPPGTDMNFLNCLNSTIGASIPIMDSAGMRALPALGGLNVVGIVWLLVWLLKVF